MTTIKGKAGALITGIKKLAMPYGSNVLFNPLRLTLKDGKVRCAVQSADKTAFIMAETSLGTIEGEGDVTFDAQQMIKFLGVYNGDDEVTITIGDTINIKGARKTSTIYPEALTPLVMTNIPKVENGTVHYRDGPATTKVEIDVAELEGLIADAKMVEMANFPLTFSANGSYAALGSSEAKHNSIETRLHCRVEGPDASIVIGDAFPFIFTNLGGVVQVQLSDEKPLAVLTKDDAGRYLYILAPRRND